MNTIKIIALISIIILFSNCDSKTRFRYLKLHRTKWTEADNKMNGIFNSTPKGNKIQEYILVENIPSDQFKLKKIMIQYFDSLKNADDTDPLLSRREVHFYKYSARTKSFVNSVRDYDFLSRTYIYDKDEDYLATIKNEKFLKESKEYTIMKFNNQIDTLKMK